jgi:protein disulfide-isomerase
MKKNFRALFATLITFGVLNAAAAPGPYDEAADAKADIAAALAAAQKDKVPVLVVFGANWCGDCKMLDTAFKEGASAPLIAKNYKVVKVDVARFTKNVDVAEAYGVPLKKGIPAIAVLGENGKVLYATTGGELADARKMGDTGVYDFFAKVVPAKR